LNKNGVAEKVNIVLESHKGCHHYTFDWSNGIKGIIKGGKKWIDHEAKIVQHDRSDE
jgi:hypothetical protein